MSSQQDKEGKDKEAKDKKISIVVNTRPKTVEKNEDITFEKAINLAYDGSPPNDPNVTFTVMYQRAEGNKDGTLTSGQSVKAKEGMIFDVTATVRS